MSFDSTRGVTVLHGGLDATGTIYSNETWEWNGVVWTLVSTGGPQRATHTMVYDTVRQVTVLFGGTENGAYKNDTWEWDGTTWTLVCTSCAPPTRQGGSMIFDPVRNLTVLFGGYSPGLLNGTWTYDGTSWTSVTTTTPPSPRSWSAADYDPVRDRFVIFGGNLQPVQCGTNSDETWELDLSVSPAVWNQMATIAQPTPRHGAKMAYDILRGCMVLYGGSDGCAIVVADTWEYDGIQWTLSSLSSAPAPRWFHTMVYDSWRQEPVLFGGSPTFPPGTPGGTVVGGTWILENVVFSLPGTGDDLTLATIINGVPLAACNQAFLWDVITTTIASPTGTLANNTSLYVLMELFTGTAPFPAAIPGVLYFSPGAALVVGPGLNPPFSPLVPFGGMSLSLLVPPGLGGQSLLIQAGAAPTPLAANGIFAATDAHIVRF